MTDEELESAIYGPLTRSINPNCPCRVVSIHEAAAAHGMPVSDIERVRAGCATQVPAELHGYGDSSSVGITQLLKYAAIAFVLYKLFGIAKAKNEAAPIQAR